MELEELEKKIDDNAEKIIANMNKLHSHEEKIEDNSKRIKENSYALEILRDYKKTNKRQFIIIFVILVNKNYVLNVKILMMKNII